MKKLVLLLLILLVVVGCGKKGPKIHELNCKKTISDSVSSVTYDNKYTYEDGALKKVVTDTSLQFTTEGLDNLETFKSYAEATKNEYNKKDGVEATLSINDATINIVVNYDVSKMSGAEIENNNYKITLNDYREKLEKDGYTCK